MGKKSVKEGWNSLLLLIGYKVGSYCKDVTEDFLEEVNANRSVMFR